MLKISLLDMSLKITHSRQQGPMRYICISNLTIIGSNNGLSPDRRQSIIWTSAGILFIGPLGTNFSEILIEIHQFSLKKIHLNMSSRKWRPLCFTLYVLKNRFSWSSQYLNQQTPVGTTPQTIQPISVFSWNLVKYCLLLTLILFDKSCWIV